MTRKDKSPSKEIPQYAKTYMSLLNTMATSSGEEYEKAIRSILAFEERFKEQITLLDEELTFLDALIENRIIIPDADLYKNRKSDASRPNYYNLKLHKYGIPNQLGLIDRPQLLKQLAQVLLHRVTLLSTPPGCGKTTLAAQYANDVECHVIWHNITEFQQDMRVMVSHLLLSLSSFVTDINTLNNLIDQPPEVIAHGIARLLDEQTSETFILILDDWHHFSSHHPANQWLRTFITFMPKNCHLLLLSQTIPPINFIEMIAKREILAIQQEDFYFTQAEVYLLSAKLQSGLDSKVIQLIWERLGGWAAGTVLALQSETSQLLQQLNMDNSSSEVLFQSIAQDMLRQQAPHIQQFLEWTSSVASFDATICGEEVLRLDDWQRTLSEVISKNLFIQQDGLGYKYHNLFRQFLQTHFRLTRPEAYSEAHHRIASWYERQGESDLAIEYYLNANEATKALALIESVAYSYYVQGRIESLRHFADLISDFALSTPHFDYTYSKIALNYDRDTIQARYRANRALDVFEQDQKGLWYHRTHYQIANIEFFQGNYQRAYDICEQIKDPSEQFRELYGLILNRQGMCSYLLGDTQSAIENLEVALEILEELSGWLEQSYVLQNIEIVYRALGIKDKADSCLQRLVHLRRLLDNPEQLALALNNMGYQYYVDGHYDEARASFEEGLETIHLFEHGRSRYFLYASLGDLDRDCGYYEKAREYYQEALSLVGENEPFMRCETLTHFATLYRWQGRSEAAMICALEAKEIAKSHQIFEAYQLAQLESMHIRLQPYNIRTVAQEAQNLKGKDNSTEALILLLRLAHFKNDTQAIQAIIKDLREQYSKGADLSYFFAELANNPNLTELRQKILLHNGIFGEHLQKLLKASDSSTRRIIIPITPPTSSLEIYALGAEIIRQDGQRVTDSEWGSQIAREMFLYFVFNKPTQQYDIYPIFWEDKPLDSAADLFHQAITQIRQVVGGQTILYDPETNEYGLNPQVSLWCDALRLDTLVDEAQKLGVSSFRSLEIWSQATQLLTGDFLPNLDRQWITELRSKYQQLTVDAWMNLGYCNKEQQDYMAAVKAFQVAAQHDELLEASYREQMICWSNLGERHKITYTYNLLRQNLKNELAVEPSPMTHQLYIELIS